MIAAPAPYSNPASSNPASYCPASNMGFRAMSTDVTVTMVGGDPGLLDWVRARIDLLERRWSRFLPDSEISRLNRADGASLVVSDDTVNAVRAACAAWVFTRGCFDPTVHDCLLRLGYDDTIDAVRTREISAAEVVELPAPGCAGIVYDGGDGGDGGGGGGEGRGVVMLPRGVRLDLGGIGKGLAADIAAVGLLERGAAGALVNIGGDVRVVGSSPQGGAWVIEIEDPRTEHRLTAVEVCDGGVATSTTLRRRWRAGLSGRHHLVAPATGASTSTSVVGVSVVAGTAAWADALSKVPFVDPARQDCFGSASAIVMFDDGTSSSIGPMCLADRVLA